LKGIGKELLNTAISMIKEDDPEVLRITVHSSPNAIEAYKKMGFKETDYECTLHGIKYTPMELVIT
jgi:ribosomal protein S18 acetylase RimI-like enzyme